MTEKIVENQLCNSCNANVRAGSLFCYSCGSPVAPGADDLKNKKNNLTGIKGNNNSPQAVEAADAPIGRPTEKLFPETAEKAADIKNKELNVQKKSKEKNAAGRQKSRNAEKKSVEIVWETPEDSAGIWFIAASMILVLFAVGILLAMLYIR